MFLERFKEVENFTITKLPLGGNKKVSISHGERYIDHTVLYISNNKCF